MVVLFSPLLSILLSLLSSETVLVLGSLGLHLSVTYWCGYTRTLFVPHSLIGDIIINEAVTMVRSVCGLV